MNIRRRLTGPALALALASAAGPLAATGAAAFEPLAVSAERLVAATLSDEARFTGMSGAQIEQQTLRLADLSSGSFEGVPTGWAGRAVKIHYRHYTHRHETRGALLLVPGFTEGLAMYQELIHDMVANGFSVYIHDHRGQGWSTRLLDDAEDADKGHLDQFDHLVTDLDRFIGIVQAARRARGQPAAPMFALAHSMGGAVLSLHLERQGAATPFAAVAMVTPMHEPSVGGTGLGRTVDRAAQGWCDDFAVQLPFQLPWLSARRVRGQGFDAARAEFERSANPADNDLTHSVPRLQRRWPDRALPCDGPHCGHRDPKVEGPTLRWVSQACSGAREARGPAAAHIARPVLLLNGGQDTVVETPAQRAFCDAVNAPRPPGAPAGRCIGYTLPGARHGLLYETDDLRRPALAQVLGFFECVREGGRSDCR
jgi:lysophospholipase